MEVEFSILAHSQLLDWKAKNKKIYARIDQLIGNIKQSPYEGIGKPEPLKHELSGYWSRRINKEHRLVYKDTRTSIIVISCKYHY